MLQFLAFGNMNKIESW